MERRDFLKATCSLCALASVGLAASSLSSCSNLPIYKTTVHNNQITVPVVLFAQSNLQLIRPVKSDYDIALQKGKDGTYAALLLSCTHSENQLSSTGNGYICNLHGSRFDKEGHVLKGPAALPLKKYPTSIVSDNIIITLH